jgi:hypothetical protein
MILPFSAVSSAVPIKSPHFMALTPEVTGQVGRIICGLVPFYFVAEKG